MCILHVGGSSDKRISTDESVKGGDESVEATLSKNNIIQTGRGDVIKYFGPTRVTFLYFLDPRSPRQLVCLLKRVVNIQCHPS